MRGDVGHFRLRLLDCHAILQTRDGLEAMIGTRIDLGSNGKWDPEFRHFRKSKAARHHADDRARATADDDLLSDGVWIAAETPLPQIVAENYDRIFLRPVFFNGKSAAQDRRNMQHFKQSLRNARASNLARCSTSSHRKPAGPVVAGDAFENLVLFTPVEKIRVRHADRVAVFFEGKLFNHSEAIRFGIRKWSQQNAVCETEDRSVCPDAESEG